MRLICPNCDAQYEVPDEVVPPEGRDVQCSNCGQTWYQHHPDNLPDDAEEDDVAAQDAETEFADDGHDDLSAEPERDVAVAEPEATPEPDPTPEPEPKPILFDDDEFEDDEPEDIEPRQLDPAVQDILREEAAREAQARAQADPSLESQPDLGLDQPSEDEAARRAREASERMARMRGETPPEDPGAVEAAAAAAALGSRRDLLPDIEEINSTLRSTSDRQSAPDAGGDEAEGRPARKGFGRGFTYTILLFVILALIYIYAPAIAKAVPAVDPYLNAYVAQVDALRVWFDGQVRGLLVWLDDTAASQSQ